MELRTTSIGCNRLVRGICALRLFELIPLHIMCTHARFVSRVLEFDIAVTCSSRNFSDLNFSLNYHLQSSHYFAGCLDATTFDLKASMPDTSCGSESTQS